MDWEAGMTDYGVFCGKYLVLGGFCIVLMSGIFIQVCSKTVVALRKGEQRFARVIFQSGIHIIVIYSLFFAGILAVMAEQVSNLLNSGTVAALTENVGDEYHDILQAARNIYEYCSVYGAGIVLCQIPDADGEKSFGFGSAFDFRYCICVEYDLVFKCVESRNSGVGLCRNHGRRRLLHFTGSDYLPSVENRRRMAAYFSHSCRSGLCRGVFVYVPCQDPPSAFGRWSDIACV